MQISRFTASKPSKSAIASVEKFTRQLTTLIARYFLKAEYQFNYDVISEYAPKMMSGDEIGEYLRANFSEVIATKNKGQIMKVVIPALKGKANDKTINKIVAELCK